MDFKNSSTPFCSTLSIQPLSVAGASQAVTSDVVDLTSVCSDELIDLSSSDECSTAIDLTSDDDQHMSTDDSQGMTIEDLVEDDDEDSLASTDQEPTGDLRCLME